MHRVIKLSHTGNSCRDLAERMASYLGLSLADAHVGTFANGETNVKILSSIRGDDVYIIQSGTARLQYGCW